MATIRNLDPELYREAKAQAILEGKKIGEWINQAIKEKLAKSKKRR